MITPGFSIADQTTWPDLLTTEEVATILRRSPDWVSRQCARRLFVPAPLPGPPGRGRPRLWRKQDIVRYVAPDAVPAPRGLVRRVR